jgi:glutamate synthase (NADPH/NADH) large chain
MLADQVERFYLDLADERFVSALALVHQRYSTNTFPTWDLAHPFRFLAHNGEINTVQGNRRWTVAREGTLTGGAWGDRVPGLVPLSQEGGSDSTSRDNLLEVLVRAGAGHLGGKGGGGRRDMAQAGGPEGTGAQAAIDAIAQALSVS